MSFRFARVCIAKRGNYTPENPKTRLFTNFPLSWKPYYTDKRRIHILQSNGYEEVPHHVAPRPLRKNRIARDKIHHNRGAYIRVVTDARSSTSRLHSTRSIMLSMRFASPLFFLSISTRSLDACSLAAVQRTTVHVPLDQVQY